MSTQELDKNADQIGQAIPTPYKDADFIMECKCGHTHVIEENVSGLIRYDMYTTDMHVMQLVCPACGHEFVLRFRPAENPLPVDEQETNSESVQEADAETNEDNRGVESDDVKEETAEIDEPVQEADKVQE